MQLTSLVFKLHNNSKMFVSSAKKDTKIYFAGLCAVCAIDGWKNFTLCLLRMVQFFQSRSLTCRPAPIPPPLHPPQGLAKANKPAFNQSTTSHMNVIKPAPRIASFSLSVWFWPLNCILSIYGLTIALSSGYWGKHNDCRSYHIC